MPRTIVHPYGAKLALHTDPAQYVRAMRRIEFDATTLVQALGATTLTLDTETSDMHVNVWIDTARQREPIDRVRTVIHEATHAAASILDHVGQDYDGESEALAYLVEWIAVWLMGHLS